MFSKFHRFFVNKTNISYTFVFALLLSAMTFIGPLSVGFVLGIKEAFYTFFIMSICTTYLGFVVREQFKMP